MSADQRKRELSEEDVKRLYITPALEAKWNPDRIQMEAKARFKIAIDKRFTDGKIVLRGNKASREKPKRVDYLLFSRDNYPIAVVEAKDNKHAVSDGIQQALEYAKILDVPFAYSSNGDGFVERDRITGKQREFGLDDFPTPAELVERYRNANGLSEKRLRVAEEPYYTSPTTNSPRYYQQIAINRTVDAIARGEKRLLLVMATGTGKTYTAFQIVWRLLKSDTIRKVLYLADRNILVDQSIQQDFAPLEKTIHKVDYAKDDPATVTAFEVYFALYQQLADRSSDDEDDSDGPDDAENETVSRLAKLFKPNFFDLVIVDECHRGSAKRDGSWRKILDYFGGATQIGMTATPKETKYVSNIDYFGEPVYSYSLREGIDDGFLAPFRVRNVQTNVSDGWRPFVGQLDVDGNPVEDRIYNNSDYDRKVVLLDRTDVVARTITDYLKSRDPYAKTIVFCETEAAAGRMRDALVKLNPERVKENDDYVVRITGSDDYGKSKLDYFISVGARFPTIATTSKLLSTGVDCKTTKLIVIDRNVGSTTEFKQILGRGTRLREKEGKTHFVLMDFRNVSRLFADPDWDGDLVPDDDFDPDFSPNKPTEPQEPTPEPDGPASVPFVDRDGCRVEVIAETISVYDSEGKRLRVVDVVDYTRNNVRGEYASLENFVARWPDDRKSRKIAELLAQWGIDLEPIKEKMKLTGVDDFDFLCHIAFGGKPKTRRERAENVKKRDFFSKYSGPAREVLTELLELYANEGVGEIDNSVKALNLPPFKKLGAPAKIVKYFGGRDGYLQAVNELTAEIYAEGNAIV